MIERLAPTGSGFPTVYVGEQALHSRYNPAGEAEKYINSLVLREGLLFLILIEPGLGYMIPVLRKRFPSVPIISLHVSNFFADPGFPPGAARGEPPQALAPEALRPDAAWNPGTGIALGRFLEEHIPDTGAAAIGLIEWRPSLAAYGESYLKILSETVEFIKRSDANKRTLRGFGRRWFRNVFKNIRLLKRVLRYSPGTFPLIITGAGPGLEETIPLIRERKKNGAPFILAVSSSVPALLAGDLVPDLVLSTDGGGWALFHLYETIRAMAGGKPLGLAAALSAALPSQYGDIPWLPISDGTDWQNLVLKSLHIPFTALTQRGTVTAAALDLAFLLTRGRIFITGMDLAHRDIRTHARPYGLERFIEEGASRLRPAYSQYYVRSAAISASGTHAIYAAWFKGQMAAYPQRLFSLGNNHAVLNSLKTPGEEVSAGAAEFPRDTITALPVEDPVELASRSLIGALSDPPGSAAIRRELADLLFPDMPHPAPGDLIEEVRNLTGPYRGGAPDG
ncbi:MAG: DUF115 domain-containing protein [Treponema sp.]|jgi:hypothetical protein|nr:DUF115 domain-containing protein [Treponema sp.]